MRREWTAEEETIADEMAATGLSSYQIASALNRSHSAVTSAFSRRGIRLPRKGGADLARIAAIRELAKPAELSARQIGERLGITRNAVIGLAHRHGIQLRTPQPPKARTAESPPRPRKPWSPSQSTVALPQPATVEVGTGLECLPDPVPAELVAPAAEPFPDGGKIFVDLPDNPAFPRFCRFISDAEAAAPILTRRCCGGATVNGTSYCAAHAHLAIDRKRTKQSSERAKRRDAA